VGLALGSGAARGWAHIGIIRALERLGVKPDLVAGCSIGSFVGAAYAAGELDKLESWVRGFSRLQVVSLLDPALSGGLFRGEKVFGKIHEIVGEIDIEQLAIPYTAVATDLTNQQEIWFQEGCLHKAMRASAAIPSLFTPVTQGSRMLVDGGLLNPLPIVPVVSSHCDLIVAVNLNSLNQKQYSLPVIERPAAFKGKIDQLMGSLSARLPFLRRDTDEEEGERLLTETDNPWIEPKPPKDHEDSAPKSASSSQVLGNVGPASLLELVNQSFEAMQTSLAQYKIAGYPPDILINVPKRVCRFFEFHKAPELIMLGRQIANDTLDKYEREHG